MSLRSKCTHVRAYVRWRFGKLEQVCSHWRSGPWCQLMLEI